MRRKKPIKNIPHLEYRNVFTVPLNGRDVIIDRIGIHYQKNYYWTVCRVNSKRVHSDLQRIPYLFLYTPRINGIRRRYLYTRLLMGAKPNQDVIHLNGNSLDCRQANLRIVPKGSRSYLPNCGRKKINESTGRCTN